MMLTQPVHQLIGTDEHSEVDRIQIHDGCVAWRLFVRGHIDCQLEVWDWRTNQLLWVSIANPPYFISHADSSGTLIL